MQYQQQGVTGTLNEANSCINAARNSTPLTLRHCFFSTIRWEDGHYVWGWLMK